MNEETKITGAESPREKGYREGFEAGRLAGFSEGVKAGQQKCLNILDQMIKEEKDNGCHNCFYFDDDPEVCRNAISEYYNNFKHPENCCEEWEDRNIEH